MHLKKPFQLVVVASILVITGCDQVIPFPSPNTTSSLISSLITSQTLTSSNIGISSSSATSAEESSITIASSSFDDSSIVESSSSVTNSSSLSSSASLPIYDGYYASINGVTDQALKPTLTTLLRSILDSNQLLPTTITYGNARYDIPKYDRDPDNINNVILVYSQISVMGTWDSGVTWNREHVFPQSLMGVDTSNTNRHKGADYHNLKPESPSVNTSRGNKYFAETTTTTSYAPPVSVRGDIARIMFYMVTMWPELSLVDVVSTAAPQIYQMAQLSLFVKWHFQDPVDAFEQNRNEVIYSLQGNRNPYIDHEEFVCRIWGNANLNTQGYCAA